MKKIPIYACKLAKEPIMPYFSSVNMTLVSIIQSVVIAYLLYNIFEDIFNKKSCNIGSIRYAVVF